MLNGVIMRQLFNYVLGRKSGLFLAVVLFLTFLSDASALVAMKLEMTRKVYMQYEQVIAVLTLRNFSARPLVFGHNTKFKGSIDFQVFKGGKMVVDNKARRFALEGLMLSPGETRSLRFNISGKFKLKDTGNYEMQAFLSHSLLLDKFKSNKVNFRIDSGSVLWERTVGVPDFLTKQKFAKENGKELKTRDVMERAKVGQIVKYSICSLFDRGAKIFYLKVEDDKLIYAVRRIGSEMSEKIPRVEVDAISNLHILLRTTPRVFSYFNFDTKGRIIEHKVLKKGTSRGPVLVRSKKGFVEVVGGVDAVDKKDYMKQVEEPFNDVINK